MRLFKSSKITLLGQDIVDISYTVSIFFAIPESSIEDFVECNQLDY
jgi:hypothetical protein